MTANKRVLLTGQWLLAAVIAAVFTLAVAKPIVLTASDLGRHLTNGRLFLDEGVIQTTNAYSYTYPDFPFLNHHWGSGVLFELARRAGGFTAVSLFGLGVVFLTALLYIRIAWKRGALWLAVVAAIVVLPVFGGRAEIRPELFSYLLSAVFLWILLGVRGGSRSPLWLGALPALILLWVNLHIYFFLGIGWMGAFFVDALFRAWRDAGNRTHHLEFARNLALVIALSCLLTLLNPNGWQGAVYPLFIFKNYAYSVAENQTILRIMAQTVFPPALYALIVLAILFVSWLWRLYRDWRNRELPDVALLILTLFVSLVAWMAIRNFTIFSYVSIVSLAYAWSDLDWETLLGRRAAWLKGVGAVVALVLWVAIYPSFWVASYRTIGIGVMPGIVGSLDFFKENNLKGPIFNNYDIGGFLTYGLYPEEKVFVDNRPEAYPGEFFTGELLPMQMDDVVWHRIDNTTRFNVIFFYRHDATGWGQGFMIRRLNDPEWAPVFVDGFTLMLIRRTPENADVVAKYEIPKSKFQVKPR